MARVALWLPDDPVAAHAIEAWAARKGLTDQYRFIPMSDAHRRRIERRRQMDQEIKKQFAERKRNGGSV